MYEGRFSLQGNSMIVCMYVYVSMYLNQNPHSCAPVPELSPKYLATLKETPVPIG
jgi:hypothetical protein